ncbi:MAG: co-chaperone GroES family protein [Ignavibacteriae bacterium]|jgi:co-chaperonin GroES (HSP10)|nr:co-chaperone GroES family protein [Ignavibacteriota bacterium]
MEITENKLKNLIIVGDRVLIKPKSLSDKTKTGLYLPPGVQEKEIVQSGYIMKVGPGYPLAQASEDIEESWKATDEKVKYIPLQVKEGDLAVFLQKGSIEVVYKDEKYFIVPQNQILMIEREEF